MFQFLQKKIEEGFGKQEFQQYMRREGLPLAFFRDEHLVDVWNRYDRPAYQKYGKKGLRRSNLLWQGRNVSGGHTYKVRIVGLRSFKNVPVRKKCVT